MQIHDLKIDKKFYHDVLHGQKRFEIRKNDREYQVNDLLVLRAYDQEARQYYDQEQHAPMLLRVTYMLADYECRGLRDGYVAMGIERVEVTPLGR